MAFCDGRYPTSIFCAPAAGDRSTLYSAVSVVNGTSWNWARCGLTGPEYFVFGTNVMCPSALNADSFHGPSTMDHSGEDTYEVSPLAWESRYLYTAAQSLALVAQCDGPEAVLSQAGGIGIICDRSLYKNQLCEYGLFVVIWISVGETSL